MNEWVSHKTNHHKDEPFGVNDDDITEIKFTFVADGIVQENAEIMKETGSNSERFLREDATFRTNGLELCPVKSWRGRTRRSLFSHLDNLLFERQIRHGKWFSHVLLLQCVLNERLFELVHARAVGATDRSDDLDGGKTL